MNDRYLAHCWDDREWVQKWELATEVKFDIELINPFSDIDRPKDNSANRRERTYNIESPNALVCRDLNAIHKARGFLGILKSPNALGTPMEISYAWRHHLKQDTVNIDYPVELIVLNGEEKHPWLIFHSTAIFTSFEEYEEYLREIL